MNSKKAVKKGGITQKTVKKRASRKEITKATDFAMTNYAEAIKRLADR